jgi:hypothetical protein
VKLGLTAACATGSPTGTSPVPPTCRGLLPSLKTQTSSANVSSCDAESESSSREVTLISKALDSIAPTTRRNASARRCTPRDGGRRRKTEACGRRESGTGIVGSQRTAAVEDSQTRSIDSRTRRGHRHLGCRCGRRAPDALDRRSSVEVESARPYAAVSADIPRRQRAEVPRRRRVAVRSVGSRRGSCLTTRRRRTCRAFRVHFPQPVDVLNQRRAGRGTHTRRARPVRALDDGHHDLTS